MNDTPTPNTPKSAPLVMDITRPKVASPDHQLSEHGTPDAASQDIADAPISTAVPSADELLQQVAMEQTTKTASRPALPVGLIAVTFVVLAILLIIAWFALSSAA